jgi:endo-1,4-beta-xylanase
MRLSRRSALGLASLAAGGGLALAAFGRSPSAGTTQPWTPPAGPEPTAGLGEIAGRGGLLFGSSIDFEAFAQPAYHQLYKREARIVTTDTALKFDWLRPTPNGFSFGPADQIVDFGATHGILVRGHCLAWNENLPDWLKRLSKAERTRIFESHIDTVVSRYAGRLHSWDVVNEPFWPGHHEPGGFRNGAWFDAMGPSYIEIALRRARAADKTVRLAINEAHCEIIHGWGDGIRPRLLKLIDDLQHRGVPLDAIGLQGHLQPQWDYDDDAFLAYVEEIAARRLDVYITELDVNDIAYANDPVQRDAQVASRYAAFLGHVLRAPRVKVVVTWQLSDRYTWYRDVPGEVSALRSPRPLLFDPNLVRKPAWRAAAQAFQNVCGSSSKCGDHGERLVRN